MDLKLTQLTLLILCGIVGMMQYDIHNLHKRINRSDTLITSLKQEQAKLKESRTAKITLTAYSPREIETDSTPYETAFMTKVKPRTIALSWDLLHRGFTPDRCVHVYGVGSKYSGLYGINDGMNKRKKNSGDIFLFSTEQAFEFGIHRDVTIMLVDCKSV